MLKHFNNLLKLCQMMHLVYHQLVVIDFKMLDHFQISFKVNSKSMKEQSNLVKIKIQ